MHAVDAVSGEILWSNVQKNVCGDDRPFCDPGISAAVTAVPGAVIAGHLDGHLRAYDGESGKVVWDFDMAREFQAVGGRAGRGGSVSGAGPLVADELVVVSAGYGLYFHEPGNLLMVFGLPD
jgi:polyvinyl alcohol dehydrogenase (cytochrome)